MGFFGFGKKKEKEQQSAQAEEIRLEAQADETSGAENAQTPAGDAEQAAQDEKKQGLFSRLWQGLSKTRGNVAGRVDELIEATETIDEDFYEDLVDILIMSDMGVRTSDKVIQELKTRVARERITDAKKAREILKDILKEIMGMPRKPLKWPMVMLVVGVNGVGKTTTVVNLGAALARKGKSVLCIDFDPQANLTNYVAGCEPRENTIASVMRAAVLFQPADIRETIYHSERFGFDFIPSDLRLSEADIYLATAMSRETVLRRVLEPVRQAYDYILIDCNPSLGLLLTNVLVASNQVIIPVQTQYFATQGLSSLEGVIGNVRMTLNPDLSTVNILLTFKDKTSVATAVTETLREQYPQSVFATEITRKQEAINSSMMGKPAGGDTGAEYRALADELIAREG